jgi:hypothetical protein
MIDQDTLFEAVMLEHTRREALLNYASCPRRSGIRPGLGRAVAISIEHLHERMPGALAWISRQPALNQAPALVPCLCACDD